jgi:tight adherence protein C
MFCIFILSIIQTIDIAFLGFYIGVIIVVFFVIDKEIDRKINKRHMLLQYDFPEFVNKLVLLINAGLGVSRAWVKILTDSNSKSPLYDELKIVLLKLESGKSEQSAYEEFARSCRIPEITKFVSILIQHSKKGNSDLVTALRLQAFECWQMRKNIARRLGEEASVKMIFPLMIMFIAVLMIVAAPAVIFIIF